MIEFDFLGRTVFALALILGGLLLFLLYNRSLARRTRQLLPGLGPVRPGAFVLVYFTTPSCVPCKTVQRPAIEQVKATLGEKLEVLEIDATEKPDIASRWGVLSVPTTYVIDRHGEVRYINHGVTRYEKLLQQLQTLADA